MLVELYKTPLYENNHLPPPFFPTFYCKGFIYVFYSQSLHIMHKEKPTVKPYSVIYICNMYVSLHCIDACIIGVRCIFICALPLKWFLQQLIYYICNLITVTNLVSMISRYSKGWYFLMGRCSELNTPVGQHVIVYSMTQLWTGKGIYLPLKLYNI